MWPDERVDGAAPGGGGRLPGGGGGAAGGRRQPQGRERGTHKLTFNWICFTVYLNKYYLLYLFILNTFK